MSEDRNCVDCIFFSRYGATGGNSCFKFDDWNLTNMVMTKAKQCSEYKEKVKTK